MVERVLSCEAAAPGCGPTRGQQHITSPRDAFRADGGTPPLPPTPLRDLDQFRLTDSSNLAPRPGLAHRRNRRLPAARGTIRPGPVRLLSTVATGRPV